MLFKKDTVSYQEEWARKTLKNENQQFQSIKVLEFFCSKSAINQKPSVLPSAIWRKPGIKKEKRTLLLSSSTVCTWCTYSRQSQDIQSDKCIVVGYFLLSATHTPHSCLCLCFLVWSRRLSFWSAYLFISVIFVYYYYCSSTTLLD